MAIGSLLFAKEAEYATSWAVATGVIARSNMTGANKHINLSLSMVRMVVCIIFTPLGKCFLPNVSLPVPLSLWERVRVRA
jgi:hypothetical protein